jgi:1-acyl-sn-glycerol-3-phosphate acyltransferase
MARHVSEQVRSDCGAEAAILPRVSRPPRPGLVYSLIAVLSWPVLKLLFRLRARGRENVPAEGGFVLAANHTSNFDPWPLGLPLFPRRYLRFMAKSELFWFPLSAVLRAGGAFRVRRGRGDEEAIAKAVELCREGHVVVMFPEGTRRRKGLRKRHEARWHSGAARIALDAEVPLVPAAILGTDRLARLGPLRVEYGARVAVHDLAHRAPGEAARLATVRLRESIENLEHSLP